MSNPARRAYVAWDRHDEHDDPVAVFASDAPSALAEACEDFGYRLQELAELRKAPHQVVRVVRAPMLDRYEGAENVPPQALDEAIGALMAQGRTHTRSAALEDEGEDSALEMPVGRDDNDGEIEL